MQIKVANFRSGYFDKHATLFMKNKTCDSLNKWLTHDGFWPIIWIASIIEYNEFYLCMIIYKCKVLYSYIHDI